MNKWICLLWQRRVSAELQVTRIALRCNRQRRASSASSTATSATHHRPSSTVSSTMSRSRQRPVGIRASRRPSFIGQWRPDRATLSTVGVAATTSIFWLPSTTLDFVFSTTSCWRASELTPVTTTWNAGTTASVRRLSELPPLLNYHRFTLSQKRCLSQPFSHDDHSATGLNLLLMSNSITNGVFWVLKHPEIKCKEITYV